VRLDTRFLARAGVMVALAVAFQSLGLQQPITGPVVNAILFTSVEFVGTTAGALVGLVTPCVAVLTGILKVPFLVPVVIAGNVTLAVVYGLTKRFNRLGGALAAAVAKYAAMTAGIKILVAGNVRLQPPVVASMTVTQLYTALGGAAVALAVIRGLDAIAKARERGERAR
jgi:hypothetical protein